MSEFRSLLFVLFQLVFTPIWAVLVLLVFWLMLYWMYRNKIFVRI